MTPQQQFLRARTNEELQATDKYLANAVLCWTQKHPQGVQVSVLQEQRNLVNHEMQLRGLPRCAMSEMINQREHA